MSAKVAIISVFYNRADKVDASVGSVVDQLAPGMRLILVDDGSTDGTLNALTRYEAGNVEVVHHPNMGFTPSISRAIQESRSELIAIHGSGDLSLPGRFIKQVQVFDQNPRIGIVGCRSRTQRLNRKNVATKDFGRPYQGNIEEKLLKRNLFNHGEVMFRRSAYDKAGGYRTFFRFAQDRDLWCRMSHHCQAMILPDILYARIEGESNSVSGSPEKVLLQAALSDFAVYCHKERLEGNPDPLDRFGDAGALVRPRSPRLAKKYMKLAKKYKKMEQEDHAREFAKAGLREHPSLPNKLRALRYTTINRK